MLPTRFYISLFVFGACMAVFLLLSFNRISTRINGSVETTSVSITTRTTSVSVASIPVRSIRVRGIHSIKAASGLSRRCDGRTLSLTPGKQDFRALVTGLSVPAHTYLLTSISDSLLTLSFENLTSDGTSFHLRVEASPHDSMASGCISSLLHSSTDEGSSTVQLRANADITVSLADSATLFRGWKIKSIGFTSRRPESIGDTGLSYNSALLSGTLQVSSVRDTYTIYEGESFSGDMKDGVISSLSARPTSLKVNFGGMFDKSKIHRYEPPMNLNPTYLSWLINNKKTYAIFLGVSSIVSFASAVLELASYVRS